MSIRVIKAVDLYCGAGGSSTGLYRAAKSFGYDVNLVAINHWKAAIATHSKNHPHARHLETSVNSVDPLEAVPGGHLDILWASPECIFFSQARGGKPVKPQSRASGWHILHWAETLRIDNIIIENVKEYRQWGPLKRVLRFNKKLGKNQRVWVPDPKRRGETFQAFLAALRSLNYRVEERVLNAADYGDPTTRQRLFIIAKRGQRKIQWPEPSHTGSDNQRLFGERKKWRAAREIIDWSLPGQSIFNRKRPLADPTIKRILAGLEKFGGKELQPFLVVLRNHADAQSVEEPIPTICAGGNHIGVAKPAFNEKQCEDCGGLIRPYKIHPDDWKRFGFETDTCVCNGSPVDPDATRLPHIEPFQVIMRGKSKVRSIEEPTPTGSTSGAHLGIAQPFILGHRQFNEDCVDSIERPLRTITAKGGTDMALVEPFVVGAGGPERAGEPASVDKPLSTILTRSTKALVQPFLLPHRIFNFNGVDSVEDPLRTLRAQPHNQSMLIEPFIVPQFGERDGQAPRTHSIDEPLPAVTSHGAGAVVEPVLVTVNHGNGSEGDAGNSRRAHCVDDPVPGLTGSPSLAVAEPFLLQLTHGGRVHDVNAPVPTITTAHRGETGVVNPLIHKYYGTGQCRPVSEPLDTITAKDRFGLVMPVVNGYALDIRFRMLQPKELAKAMGFDEDYQFEGNREQIVKMIGNAVCVNVAQALCESVLS